MPGKVPENFDLLAPDSQEDDLVRVRQLHSGYPFAFPTPGNIGAGYKTLKRVAKLNAIR